MEIKDPEDVTSANKRVIWLGIAPKAMEVILFLTNNRPSGVSKVKKKPINFILCF